MKTTTIIAEALADNRNYKNAKIDGKTIGVAEARAWQAMIKALRMPAYAIAKIQHDNMGATEVKDIDMTEFFNALRPIINAIGEVNGAKLFPENCAQTLINQAVKIRIIDISDEMAHARSEYREANKVKDESEEKMQAYENAKAEVKRLEGLPNNCKRLFDREDEAPFIRKIEIALGDAINGQMMKPVEQVIAEDEARHAARRAKTAAKKAAKKAAAANK